MSTRQEDGSVEEQFRHWTYTWDDFWIWVRCSDGSELGGWLSDASEKTGAASDPFVRMCIDDLRKEAAILRGNDKYRIRSWCDYINRPF